MARTATYTPGVATYRPGLVEATKEIRARINLVTDTTPTFTWDTVSGANRYGVRFYNFNSTRRPWSGWTGNEPSYTVPPGVLLPNSLYRLRFEAMDAHNPLDVDNVSRTPAATGDYYGFYTDGNEAVDPFIELDNHGVYTFTGEGIGTQLRFWIIVHDAQGVPGNINR
jgi:hypothetical protein